MFLEGDRSHLVQARGDFLRREYSILLIDTLFNAETVLAAVSHKPLTTRAYCFTVTVLPGVDAAFVVATVCTVESMVAKDALYGNLPMSRDDSFTGANELPAAEDLKVQRSFSEPMMDYSGPYSL